jgi:uncharacterized protein (TIGR02996 family)
MTSVALHPDELALLYSVCAEPDDDAPRLVLADWYTESGDPLLVAFAEFIRQQVADSLRSINDGIGNAADDPSKYLAGSALWKRERAHGHLLGIFSEAL